ncbi:MAG: hydrogenase maturation protease [Pirellulaceae bacterium]|nr:hydrogenase maturation protease [Pirellulaceae bacterium]
MTLIVGIGSPFGDDQAGWRVAALLADHLHQDHCNVRQAKSPIEIFDWLDRDYVRLILCDACRGSGTAGQISRFDWPSDSMSESKWSGTHDFSLVATLQLAERLGRLPERVIVWSIESSDHSSLEEWSTEVAAASIELCRMISREVQRRD